jgi:hypothetical protein
MIKRKMVGELVRLSVESGMPFARLIVDEGSMDEVWVPLTRAHVHELDGHLHRRFELVIALTPVAAN